MPCLLVRSIHNLTFQQTLPFVIISAHTPESAVVSLRKASGATFLWIQRPVGIPSSGYVVEKLGTMREALRIMGRSSLPDSQATSWPENVELSNMRVPWPRELTDVPGLWKYPLNTTFYNLKVLDLEISDAVYWLIPILQATHSSAPLQRILLRSCDNYMWTVVPFQFKKLEEILQGRPAVKLLLAWARTDDDPFVKAFRRKLRNLDEGGRIGVLYDSGPKCKLQYFIVVIGTSLSTQL